MSKHYKLFRVKQRFPDGNIIADYIGNALGDIDTGASVMSNSNRGPGYLTGHIQSTRAGAFILQDIEILTLPGGERLLLQASIGAHDLEFISSFIDFIELQKPQMIKGEYFEGFDGTRKAYFVKVKMEGKPEMDYIMTNESESKSPAKKGSSTSIDLPPRTISNSTLESILS